MDSTRFHSSSVAGITERCPDWNTELQRFFDRLGALDKMLASDGR